MDLEELFRNLPIDEIARNLDTDRNTASQAVQSAMPALLERIQQNARSGGADSLSKALQEHNNDLVREGPIELAKVDRRDGEKIVSHVFGDPPERVATRLGEQESQAPTNILGQLLPMLAPIAMSFLANNVLGRGNQQRNLQQEQQSGGLDLGGLLEGILGGGQQQGGLDLGSIIGGLLGRRNS